MSIFKKEYDKLNEDQREAVESIDGPVMVVAGPGTGKTQVLALRIGNILKKAGIPADGILCLTFTNSGVRAMRKRLSDYGIDNGKVHVSTFHSFGILIIEEFKDYLDLDTIPKIVEDTEMVSLYDEVLNNNEWEYLKPRSDSSRYFRDLKSLISILKREEIKSEYFLSEIENDIYKLENDENNISTRGESKGKLKKEIIKKIESLERTKEVVRFYEIYDKNKKEKNLFDYDDVLLKLIELVSNNEDVKAELKERFLYVLVDEHQDSSNLQNKFLKIVWGEEDKPNIFVVGDDRQLIYGFSGASLSYFEGFKNAFGKARLITLIKNYRSTQVILDSAHKLLESKITKDKLVSTSKESHPIRLIESDYERDEIIRAGLDIKEKIKNGILKEKDLNEFAILVPKNKQVKSAVLTLKSMNLKVASHNTLQFFDAEDTLSFIRILKIILNPYDEVSLLESFFDKNSNINPISAHKFIKENEIRNISLISILENKKNTLFGEEKDVDNWILKLKKWISYEQQFDLHTLIQKVGEEFLIDNAKDHDELIYRIEIVRTMIHLVLSQIEKNPKLKLKDFISFLDRIESYGENIPMALFNKEDGIKVITLHSSKGLEFDYVWIAHMNERSLMSGKKINFTLPSSIEEKIEKKDEEIAKRELYVAITRAKRFCTISYSKYSYTGREEDLANIIRELPTDIFLKEDSSMTEKYILEHDPKIYLNKNENEKEEFTQNDLIKIVSNEYKNTKVSVSLLNNFFECPRRWYFRNLLKLPEAKSESLEFGNLIHNTIDKILKSKKVLTKKELDEIEKIDKKAKEIISNWILNRFPKIEKNYENEKSLSLKDDLYPHLNIYGKLDLIEELPDKNIRVTDFKTGGIRKKSEIEKTDGEGRMSAYLRQLSMYSYLINKNRKGSKVSESRLEFLEAKKNEEAFYSTYITDENIDLLMRDIKDYDEFVKNGTWIDRPCNYKSYGKNTECKYCKMAEIYKN